MGTLAKGSASFTGHVITLCNHNSQPLSHVEMHTKPSQESAAAAAARDAELRGLQLSSLSDLWNHVHQHDAQDLDWQAPEGWCWGFPGTDNQAQEVTGLERRIDKIFATESVRLNCTAIFIKKVDTQADHRTVLCEFAPPMPNAGPRRYRMPLHFFDDVNTVEAVSEQLASLPLEVESWEHPHTLLHRSPTMHKPALTIDGGPTAMHFLHLSPVESVYSGGHGLLHGMGYHPKIDRIAYLMLVAISEFEARQYKQEVFMGKLHHCMSQSSKQATPIRGCNVDKRFIG